MPRFESVLLMALTIWTRPGMRLLESAHRGAQAFQRELEQLRILLRAGGFVGGDFGEACDALRLLLVRLGQFRHLGFQRAQQLQELAAGAPP